MPGCRCQCPLSKQTWSLCELSCTINYIIFSLISKPIFSTILQENTYLPHYEILFVKFIFQRCLQGSRQGDVTRPAYNSVHFTFTSKNLSLTFKFTLKTHQSFLSEDEGFLEMYVICLTITMHQ